MLNLASSTSVVIPDGETTVQPDRSTKLLADRISATVRGGDATITGMIKNECERKPIVRCVAAVQGIRRVVDQLQVAEKMKSNG